MKKIFTLIMLVLAQSLWANDSIPETKVTHKFGGRIDVMIYSDSYEAIATRNGLQYIAPDKPNFNSAGEDVNFQNRLRMSASPTKFNYTMTATNILGSTLKGFIEVDFMGVSDNTFNLIRMRHVFIDMKWKTNSLLVGQTSHLSMPEEVAANTVTYGGGYPLYPLNRPVQVQYSQYFGKYTTLTAAAAMFGGSTGDMQSYSLVPDIQLRLTSGNPARHSYGVFAGVKSTKPRTLTDNGSIAKSTVTAFNAGLFARYIIKPGYAIRWYGIWGQDLAALSILGGFAPMDEDRGVQDYRYTTIAGMSTYLDFESPQFKSGWQWGIFGGMQQNLGAKTEIDPAKVNVSNPGMDNFWRVAPRVFFHYKNHVSFGLEYMISGAEWAKKMDKFYKPLETYGTTINHRMTFLARYKF